jgi:LDH2 family malate/lactate/ureidoglycolate dehydrogenase
MDGLLKAMSEEPDVRLPGLRRLENRTRAAEDGLVLTPALHAEIRALAGA